MLCRDNLPSRPVVYHKSDQIIIIKIASVRGDTYYEFIHASNSYVERRQLWDILMPLSSLNLCLMGDFNAIVGSYEQFSSRQINRRSCIEFLVSSFQMQA